MLSERNKAAVHKAAAKGVDDIDRLIERFVKLTHRLPVDSPEFTLVSNAIAALRDARSNIEIVRNRTKY